MFDPGERDALEEEYRRNRERLISERDGKVDAHLAVDDSNRHVQHVAATSITDRATFAALLSPSCVAAQPLARPSTTGHSMQA
jgi:hypothetical protein